MIGTRIGAIVVTHESQQVIWNCLHSLTERLPANAPIIVVDNGSTDSTRDIVLEFHPRVHLLLNDRNVGFALANNRGAGSDGLGDTVDWILLVNPDAILVRFDPRLLDRDTENDFIGQLAFALDDTSDGATEAVLRMPPSLGPLWAFTWGQLKPKWFPRLFKLAPNTPAVWASGAFCAIRRSAWEKVGGFDERFFLYHEDVDLSRRLVDAGFQVATSHAAAVRHSRQRGAEALTDAERDAFRVSGWLTYERKWQGSDHAQRLWSLLRANLVVEALMLRPLERLHPIFKRKARHIRELQGIVDRAAHQDAVASDFPSPESAICVAIQPELVESRNEKSPHIAHQ